MTAAVVRRGTCRICVTNWTRRYLDPSAESSPVKHPITDENRLAPHIMNATLTPEQFLQKFPGRELVLCEGVGTLCVESRELARMKRFAAALADQRWLPPSATPRERRMHLIKLAAPLARVALDAELSGVTAPYIVGSPFRLEIPWLMRLAIVAWREAYDATKRKVETYKTVERQGTGGRSVDVYCLFCGELLRANVFAKDRRDHGRRAKSNFTESTYYHTIPCALTRLSGMQPFVPRGTLKLPTDVQPEQNLEGTTDADRPDAPA